MDPICHTLVGASLGCTGLEKKTRFGRATLIIAANLPDIDVVTMFWGGASSYAFRRGITHGLPALVVLPVLLAALMLLLGRVRPGPENRPGPGASFRWLLLLSAVGVASHPALDWLNTYGMRWLMPMIDQWYYGDTLFIVDWVVWLALAVGLLAARLGSSDPTPWNRRPAVLALAFVVLYIGANFGVTQMAEHRTLQALRADPPLRMLASPVPLNPLRRDMVLEYEQEYRFGSYAVYREPPFELVDQRVAKGDPGDLAQAARDRDGRWFLHWARFPYAVAENRGGERVIRLADARYVRDMDNPQLDGFAVYTVRAAGAEYPQSR